MVKLNKNFLKLQDNYLFSTVNRKLTEYKKKYPDKKIINLGIGDVTKPIPNIIVENMKMACDEMKNIETFRGYGPEQGYDFLKEKIIRYDYSIRGINLDLDEVFISDGSKCDVGNIVDLFAKENLVAITDPVYPVYLDTNIIAGRDEIKNIDLDNNNLSGIILMPCNKDNSFVPKIPNKIPDIIYLCYPNNPTGIALEKSELKKWVDFAKKNNSIILFDSAYEAFITESNIPHSIYEIEGAKEVAIEFRSFSKTAGFTGIRCAYTIVPKELKRKVVLEERRSSLNNDDIISINKIWSRRHCTKFNGVSYITQRGAEAVYCEEVQKILKENIKYYLENAKIIKEKFINAGFNAYGGVNSPYVWLEVPKGKSSWDFFDDMIEEYGIVGTPGSGFGENGEGYFRLTGFGKREDAESIKLK
ncbi:MAG: LL-diaminopimelate aminotransferase [Clostridia bacterium]|jgi:LL-diaminopimelate aminotransferase